MDKKQKKAHKRKEKLKREKLRSSKPAQKEAINEAKKFGVIQIAIFCTMAVAGALVVIFNV
jgi:hypothetical protein